MTLEELIAREAIRDTLAIAARAGDHLIVEDYVGCFTPDGILEFGDRLHNAGHDEIRAWVESAKRHEAKRGLMRHSVTATQIALDGTQGAHVRSYYHVYTDIGPDHFGWYDDRFAPHGARWLIKHRIVGVDWVSPQSRFARKK
jgi:hypothetical protein